MKTYEIKSNNPLSRNGVIGVATLGVVSCFFLSVSVNTGGQDYKIFDDEFGNVRVAVVARGYLRKVKMNGPTYRKVLARALFPRATTFPQAA